MGRRRLPASERDVLPELADELDRRVGQLATDLRLAGTERVADEPQEPLPEGAFQVETHGTHRAAGRDPSRIRTGQRTTGNGRAERRGNSRSGSVLELPVLPRQHEPRQPLERAPPRRSAGTPGHPRASPRQPNGTVSAGPFTVDTPVPDVPQRAPDDEDAHPGLLAEPLGHRGGQGLLEGGRDHRHPGAGDESRPRQRHLDEPASRVGDEQRLEHLGHRVALPTDLQYEHVVRAGTGPADLDLQLSASSLPISLRAGSGLHLPRPNTPVAAAGPVPSGRPVPIRRTASHRGGRVAPCTGSQAPPTRVTNRPPSWSWAPSS